MRKGWRQRTGPRGGEVKKEHGQKKHESHRERGKEGSFRRNS